MTFLKHRFSEFKYIRFSVVLFVLFLNACRILQKRSYLTTTIEDINWTKIK